MVEALQIRFVPDEEGNIVDKHGDLRIDSVVPKQEEAQQKEPETGITTSEDRILFQDGFDLITILGEISKRKNPGIK